MLENYVEGRYRSMLPGVEEANTSADRWRLFHIVFHHEIGHYFRNIYQILKFVDTSEVENKLFYSNLLRAQLSSDELALLFYNCLSEFGSKKFKPLLERYEFLEHLPTYEHISEEDARRYDPKTYGQSVLWRKLLGLEE